MIGRRRHVVVVNSPTSIVDKPGDPALGLLPYGYEPVYVVDNLVEAQEMNCLAGTACL